MPPVDGKKTLDEGCAPKGSAPSPEDDGRGTLGNGKLSLGRACERLDPDNLSLSKGGSPLVDGILPLGGDGLGSAKAQGAQAGTP